MIDLRKEPQRLALRRLHESSCVMSELNAFFLNNGLFTLMRWGSFFCNPPLCITEAQLKEGFEIIDRGLKITDDYFEG